MIQYEYLPYFISSNVYYESLNAILSENPVVFKDKIFYDRMMKILNLNSKLYNNDKKIVKINKKLVKNINYKMKRIDKK